MAPADINLSQTRRWLAQLHTTNLPPSPPAISSGLSTDSSSADESHNLISPISYSIDGSATSGADSNDSSSSPVSGKTTTAAAAVAVPPSPLTETRAKSLQRLCEIGDAHSTSLGVPPAASTVRDVNARFAPSNINYVHPTSGNWSAADNGALLPDVSPTLGRSRRSRKQSVQSLEALEGSSMRRFSLSRFRLR